MTNEENTMKLSEQDLLLTETVIKIAAIERLLIKSGVISDEAIKSEIKTISEEIIKYITSTHQVKKNELEKIL